MMYNERLMWRDPNRGILYVLRSVFDLRDHDAARKSLLWDRQCFAYYILVPGNEPNPAEIHHL